VDAEETFSHRPECRRLLEEPALCRDHRFLNCTLHCAYFMLPARRSASRAAIPASTWQVDADIFRDGLVKSNFSATSVHCDPSSDAEAAAPGLRGGVHAR